jgi:hypothetical protein
MLPLFIDGSRRNDEAEQDHWSEREQATPVTNSHALGRPRRPVLTFGIEIALPLTHRCFIYIYDTYRRIDT